MQVLSSLPKLHRAKYAILWFVLVDFQQLNVILYILFTPYYHTHQRNVVLDMVVRSSIPNNFLYFSRSPISSHHPKFACYQLPSSQMTTFFHICQSPCYQRRNVHFQSHNAQYMLVLSLVKLVYSNYALYHTWSLLVTSSPSSEDATLTQI